MQCRIPISRWYTKQSMTLLNNFIKHKTNTQEYESQLSLTNIRAELENPHCPSTVVHKFLNIILQSTASAQLLRWPIITNMNH